MAEVTGVSLSKMLFYDDEHRNIQEVGHHAAHTGTRCYRGGGENGNAVRAVVPPMCREEVEGPRQLT